jgi:hypothetical protein
MTVDREVVVSRLDLMARLLADLDSAGQVTRARLEGERLLRVAERDFAEYIRSVATQLAG